MVPSISVVIPTYNRASLLPRAIRSALAQVTTSDEVIVVDDGSTDDTVAAVRAFGDAICYLRTERGGAGAARNRGIAEARGDLVAFLDSDDEWMEHKLDLHRGLFSARPDLLFAFSDMAITTLSGETLRRYLIHWHKDSRPWTEILGPAVPYSSVAPLPTGIDDFAVHTGTLYEQLARALYVFTSSTVVRRVQAGQALSFEEDLPTFEDWACYGRLAAAGSCAFLDIETAWQHGHGLGRVSDADQLSRTTARLALLERIWGSDPDYLARHADEYHDLLDHERLGRAVAWLNGGNGRAAREEVARMRHPPRGLWLLSRLPGPLTRDALALRRWMMRRA